MKKNNCPTCGKGEISFHKVKNFQTMVRGIPFTVPEATIGRCNSCGEKIFDPSEIRRWQQLYDTELLLGGKLLKPAEVREIRDTLGLQINQFARLLGTTRQSVYNWEREDRKGPQLRLVDLLLRLIRESAKTGTVDVVHFLREQAGIDEPQRAHCGGRAEPRLKSNVVAFRRREPWEYDRIFGTNVSPDKIPRLQTS